VIGGLQMIDGGEADTIIGILENDYVGGGRAILRSRQSLWRGCSTIS
jgi:hypothetical protein